MVTPVLVSGSFDNLSGADFRLLEEASKLGPVTVLLWQDDLVARLEGNPPKFPDAERRYVLEATRYVDAVRSVSHLVDRDALPETVLDTHRTWVVNEGQHSSRKEHFCRAHGLDYLVIPLDRLETYPAPARALPGGCVATKRVIVTGCYDWLHSGHVRFFEEASGLGDLYVVLGHDANIRLLKGAGHPLFPQDQRRYVVGSIRFVKEALIATGHGWVDADPEIQSLNPDIYVVNEDGDKGGKREYCSQRGIEYRVLQRTPAPGLPKRTSTDLRGF